MTPAARAEAAIEILGEVTAAARDNGPAADVLVQRYFKARRYAGSKDRRAVRELVYRAIRRAGERPETGRAALVALADEDPALAAAFDGSPHGPAPIDPAEPRAPAGVAPGWLAAMLEASLGAAALPALLDRAPLDLRVNTLKAARDAIVIEGAVPTSHAATGLRLPEGTLVDGLPAFNEGLVEVQDEGSQLVAAACGARPGTLAIDLCAGAGGKTLALAAAMANQGRLVACDADRGRLSRLAPRAARAGVTIAETRLLDGGREAAAIADLAQAADLVVVDAPCSGTGTWRRNPEARWRLSPARLDRLVELQSRLLGVAAGLVRPGGALVYITCSLLDREGADQASRFLAAHPGWRAELAPLPAGAPHGPGWRLSPASDGTDGFFVARIVRPC